MDEPIVVEVACAERDRQYLRRINVRAGATAADAIAACGIIEAWGLDAGALDVGIWSRRVAPDTVLAHGDRVELYRALTIDPKEARRARALKRKT